MSVHKVGIVAISFLLTVSAYGANPFLDAKDDKPVSENFRGREWNDDFPEQGIPHEIPLTARVVTTRIAKMQWGSIFKIEFTDLKSRSPDKREIPYPQYFIVTDDRIVLLNGCPNHTGVLTLREVEEDNDCAVKKISAMDKSPEFDPGDVYGITSGKFTHEDAPWKTTIEIKGNECTYLRSHNSGHFTEIVWKKGVGLIQYANNYGADREGFRLKRSNTKKAVS
jgi:hypothetical protein